MFIIYTKRVLKFLLGSEVTNAQQLIVIEDRWYARISEESRRKKNQVGFVLALQTR